MNRKDIIKVIGDYFHTENIENGEFSYSRALKRPITGHKFVDLRFVDKNLSVIVEHKKNNRMNFNDEEKNQIVSYIKLEKELTNNNTIAILHNDSNGNTMVWKNDELLKMETVINSFEYYQKLFSQRKNDKDKVLRATSELNAQLHKLAIPEGERAQLVGNILVALNSGLQYDKALTTEEMLKRISDTIEEKISGTLNWEVKTKLLIKMLNHQSIRELKSIDLFNLILTIDNELIPFIKNDTSEGEDLLNLFFTTFNKYVGKKDKNQAFTPPHITDFMADIVNVNVNSRVLDPTTGSGSFLVQAMAKMIKKANNNESVIKKIKEQQIFGIEKEEKAFGLATTNMLMHGDAKSNVILGSLFDNFKYIKDSNINTVLMNPPFNAQQMPKDCPVTNNGVDATKGLYFVYKTASNMSHGLLATILPLQCAIGTDKKVQEYKQKMMNEHTLKAVFTLPPDVFHPGAAVDSCIMLFEIGIPHDSTKKTFFGYYKDDGFVKKKNAGRVEKINWEYTKRKWLSTFFESKEIPGLSVNKGVKYDDEWLAEAHMKTDYSTLNIDNFEDEMKSQIMFEISLLGKRRGDD